MDHGADRRGPEPGQQRVGCRLCRAGSAAPARGGGRALGLPLLPALVHRRRVAARRDRAQAAPVRQAQHPRLRLPRPEPLGRRGQPPDLRRREPAHVPRAGFDVHGRRGRDRADQPGAALPREPDPRPDHDPADAGHGSGDEAPVPAAAQALAGGAGEPGRGQPPRAGELRRHSHRQGLPPRGGAGAALRAHVEREQGEPDRAGQGARADPRGGARRLRPDLPRDPAARRPGRDPGAGALSGRGPVPVHRPDPQGLLAPDRPRLDRGHVPARGGQRPAHRGAALPRDSDRGPDRRAPPPHPHRRAALRGRGLHLRGRLPGRPGADRPGGSRRLDPGCGRPHRFWQVDAPVPGRPTLRRDRR